MAYSPFSSFSNPRTTYNTAAGAGRSTSAQPAPPVMRDFSGNFDINAAIEALRRQYPGALDTELTQMAQQQIARAQSQAANADMEQQLTGKTLEYQNALMDQNLQALLGGQPPPPGTTQRRPRNNSNSLF